MSLAKLGPLDKTVRSSIVGDKLCRSVVYARIPIVMRDALHVEAQRRGVGLNTLCLLAFDAILKANDRTA